MKWKTKQDKLPVGVPVLIEINDGQYMAGFFNRTVKGFMQFTDSSGAWNIPLDNVTRFVEIT